MKIYVHRQVATLILYALAVGLGLVTLVLILTPPAPAPMAVLISLLAVLVACVVLFHALSVELTEQELLVFFGSGLIRHRIRIDRIVDVRRVRNSWIYGWGIRWIPHGWMFNASGFDAVELELEGGRRFRIGTDDPEGLVAALREAVELARRSG